MQKISITTADGGTLSGLLWDQGALNSVLLLHMMPATKESWIELGNRLSKTGFNVLAIDFRGHGESDGGDYRNFSDEQHQDYYIDAEAGFSQLRTLFPHTAVYVGGASIGANIAIKWMAHNNDAAKGFALSPGIDYHGVRAIDDIARLHDGQKLLLAAAEDDIRTGGVSCADMGRTLEQASTGHAVTTIFQAGGHGTDLFAQHPDLYQSIVDFLTN